MDLTDIKALKELLAAQKDSDSSDDDLPKSSLAMLGPGNIGTSRSPSKPSTSRTSGGGDTVNDPKTIWNDAEIPTEVISDVSLDPRKMPEYDIKFRQNVSTEDIYLQMGNKTPGTASCEEIVVEVQLPGEDLQNVDVDVAGGKYLDLRSRDFRLHLALPFPVDPDSARAEWILDKEALKVTLAMRREFDFVNF